MKSLKGIPRLFRRNRRLLILVVVIIVLYLIFQLVSIKLINRDINTAPKAPKPQKIVATKSSSITYKERKAQIIQEISANTSKDLKLGVPLPHGVPPFLRLKYLPDKSGRFTCLTSNTMIPYAQVNDDFCDCDDHSDEPGTSACPHSVFYCTTQLQATSLTSLPVSRVNDGVCDCCDGSDERSGHSVPDFMLHSAKISVQTKLFYPCSNRCSETLKVLDETRKIKAMGARLKQEYIKAGLEHDDKKGKYGPHAIFYKLSSQCFTLKHSGFTYKVCPFVSISQSKGVEYFDLGNHDRWDESKMAAGLYELHMTGGNSMLCGGAHRSSVIIFECGLQNHLDRVSEESRCHYIFHFTTPAAC